MVVTLYRVAPPAFRLTPYMVFAGIEHPATSIRFAIVFFSSLVLHPSVLPCRGESFLVKIQHSYGTLLRLSPG